MGMNLGHWVVQKNPVFLEVGPPFLCMFFQGISTTEDMHALLLGTLIFLTLGLVSTIIVLILYKAKVMSRISAELDITVFYYL